jgi:hypothetical protein
VKERWVLENDRDHFCAVPKDLGCGGAVIARSDSDDPSTLASQATPGGLMPLILLDEVSENLRFSEFF